MLGRAGVTPIDTSEAEVTVNVAVPDTSLDVAVMVAEPAATPIARPLELMVATAGADEVQVTDVRVCFEPSLNTPVAVNWEVELTDTVEVDAESEIEVRVGVGVAAAPPPPPQAAISPVTPSSSAAARYLNPSRDLGDKRAK